MPIRGGIPVGQVRADSHRAIGGSRWVGGSTTMQTGLRGEVGLRWCWKAPIMGLGAREVKTRNGDSPYVSGCQGVASLHTPTPVSVLFPISAANDKQMSGSAREAVSAAVRTDEQVENLE